MNILNNILSNKNNNHRNLNTVKFNINIWNNLFCLIYLYYLQLKFKGWMLIGGSRLGYGGVEAGLIVHSSAHRVSILTILNE